MSGVLWVCSHCGHEFRLPPGLNPSRDEHGCVFDGECTEYLRSQGVTVLGATWR